MTALLRKYINIVWSFVHFSFLQVCVFILPSYIYIDSIKQHIFIYFAGSIKRKNHQLLNYQNIH